MDIQQPYMPYYTTLKERSRELRKNQTCAEYLLWQEIRGRKILGFKFTRQKSIMDYIADFYCAELFLIIEVDGSSHDEKQEYDEMRDRELESYGIHIKRYLNEEIEQQLPFVIQDLTQYIQTLSVSRLNLPC
jgi:very-short-patch-repair endonuclease